MTNHPGRISKVWVSETEQRTNKYRSCGGLLHSQDSPIIHQFLLGPRMIWRNSLPGNFTIHTYVSHLTWLSHHICY